MTLRERYDAALAAYQQQFHEGLPPAVAQLMRAPGRLQDVIQLLESALNRHTAAVPFEWHQLTSRWLRAGKLQRPRR